jgi:hypothetical protein
MLGIQRGAGAGAGRRERALLVERLEARELCASLAAAHSAAANRTMRRVEKMHVLTLSHLSPGNYSVSQHLRPAAVDHVLAHRR